MNPNPQITAVSKSIKFALSNIRENPGYIISPKDLGEAKGLEHIASQEQNEKWLLGESIFVKYRACMEHIEKHRLVGMKLLLLLFIGVMTESPKEDQASIEREFGRPFSDVVRLNYWSVFERGDEFADELGVSRARMDGLLAKHSWELKPPPALAFQNALDSSLAKEIERVKASSRQSLDTGAFVGPSGKAPKSAAYAEIRCDGDKLSITVTCPHPNPSQWEAGTPLVDDRSTLGKNAKPTPMLKPSEKVSPLACRTFLTTSPYGLKSLQYFGSLFAPCLRGRMPLPPSIANCRAPDRQACSAAGTG